VRASGIFISHFSHDNQANAKGKGGAAYRLNSEVVKMRVKASRERRKNTVKIETSVSRDRVRNMLLNFARTLSYLQRPEDESGRIEAVEKMASQIFELIAAKRRPELPGSVSSASIEPPAEKVEMGEPVQSPIASTGASEPGQFIPIRSRTKNGKRFAVASIPSDGAGVSIASEGDGAIIASEGDGEAEGKSGPVTKKRRRSDKVCEELLSASVVSSRTLRSIAVKPMKEICAIDPTVSLNRHKILE
jgi:hypothetical protein